MDLQLKYLEDKLEYEIDDWFYQQLGLYTIDEASLIVGQAILILSELPKQSGWSQEVAGVINTNRDDAEPLFFRIEYLNEEGHNTILIDLNEIEVDEYLDFINQKKSIKSYLNGQAGENECTIPEG
jgi:hypothetical protein